MLPSAHREIAADVRRLTTSLVIVAGLLDAQVADIESAYAGRRVGLIVGGHDRGLDWQGFANEMATRAPHAIVTAGANGPRIHAQLAPRAAGGAFRLAAASDLEAAVAEARRLLDGQGTVLLSPGAPSFGAYRDYAERGAHFARLAGFDPDASGAIPGLGVA